MILKGAGVQARTLVVPHSLAGDAGRRGANGAPTVTVEPAVAAVLAAATAEANARLAAAEAAAAAKLAAAEAEAAARLATAEAEAQRTLARAKAEAERLLGQGQVELGRAKVEAEQLLAQAHARLEEAGEIIPTAAEARRLLAENTAAAAELIAGAEAERDSLRETARAEGYAAGRTAGYEEGSRLAHDEVVAELELARTIARQARAMVRETVADAEPQIVRLALDIAQKIVAREIEADPDILRGLLTRAMLKSAGDDTMRVRLHPDAIERLGPYLDDLAGRFAGRGVEVIPDPAISPDGAIVETRTGTVDARPETQLNKIERSLLALTGE